MRVDIIINNKAGSVLGRDHAAMADDIRSAFQSSKADVRIAFVSPQDLEATISERMSASPDLVVVGGGDGTIRTAARLAVEKDVCLGVLPLGTLNLLARDIALPMNPVTAAAALSDGYETRIDVARVNGRFYVCNSLMGLALRHSQDRQRLRGRGLIARVTGYIHSMQTIFRSRRRLSIVLDDGRDRRRVRVMSAAVTNNGYDEGASFGLRRSNLSGGYLTIYMSRHRSGGSMIFAMLKAFLWNWSSDPLIISHRARRITIAHSKPRLQVSNDGEIETLSTPLTYEIVPGALRLWVPHGTSLDGTGTRHEDIAELSA